MAYFQLSMASLAILVAGYLGPAAAQTSPARKPPAAEAVTSTRPETVEQRIVTLKAALRITPEIEAKWSDVAQAMRENADRMEKLVASRLTMSAEKTTAVGSLLAYQELTEARLDGLKHLTSAFQSLYESMTPEQRKNADRVFEKQVP